MKKSDRKYLKEMKIYDENHLKVGLKNGWITKRTYKNVIAIDSAIRKLSIELEPYFKFITMYPLNFYEGDGSILVCVDMYAIEEDEEYFAEYPSDIEFEIFDDFIKKGGVCINMYSKKPKRIAEKMTDYIVYQVKYSVVKHID